MAQLSVSEALEAKHDVTVVGAGAAGLSLADALGKAGIRVLVIERGGFDRGNISKSEDVHDILSPDTHDPRWRTNNEAVGGSLHGWGGRCMPFDPEDFTVRRGSNAIGWPITYEEYAAWIKPAAEFLQTDAVFEVPGPAGWDVWPDLRVDRVETLNHPGHVSDWQSRVASGAANFDILSGMDVIALDWPAEAKSPAGLILDVAQKHTHLPCNKIVLACGGLETTRLLLEAQRTGPNRMGGVDGPLGRYYMGHLTGSIAEISFAKSEDAKAFGYQTAEGASPYRRRFTLTKNAQSYVAFWVESLLAEDVRHGSGELSFKHLISGARGNVGPHIRNVLGDPQGVISAIKARVRRQMRPDIRHPQRLATSRAGLYRLAYHAEHFPEAESRAYLSEEVDRKGRRKLVVDFEYGDATVNALIETHRTLAERLEHSALARLSLPDRDEDCAELITGQARDGYHQAGLARMSDDPHIGVVDANCGVHGTGNLYVASAAVFPVSSQANPTFSVVALALRLAKSIEKELQSAP